MDDKRTPLDDRMKSLIQELRPLAGDPRAAGAIDPQLKRFVADLFSAIDAAIHAERGGDKRVTPTAVMFWDSVRKALDQFKRRALDEPGE